MLKLPKFSGSGLYSASVCVHIPRDNKKEVLPEELREWAVIDESKKVYARRSIDVSKKYWHYHLDVGIERRVPTTGIKSTPQKVLVVPAQLRDKESATTLWGIFYIELKRLPIQNFVRVLSGLAINRSGHDLEFNECSMNIFSDDGLREIRWRRVSETEIKVHVAAVGDFKLNEDIVTMAAEVTSKAAKELVPMREKRPRTASPKKKAKRKN